MTAAAIHAAYLLLAIGLFLAVNWVGRHATSFGYASTTLFEDPNESIALNLFIRTIPPAVLMVLLSAIAVSSGHEQLRLGSYWIVLYYYIIRAAYLLIFNMHRLVSWPRFALHASIGITTAWAAYHYLIIPKNSLLPDLETAGNELWLAIFMFLYVITNNVSLSDNHSVRRRNSHIESSYIKARKFYGKIIDGETTDDRIKLMAYAIIIYEDYCRPAAVRMLERLCIWKDNRTTGVMQVSSAKSLSDEESVKLGTEKLIVSWRIHQGPHSWWRVRSVIGDYNKDDTYVSNVCEVMRVLARRIEPGFADAYESIFEEPSTPSVGHRNGRASLIRRAKAAGFRSPRRAYRARRNLQPPLGP